MASSPSLALVLLVACTTPVPPTCPRTPVPEHPPADFATSAYEDCLVSRHQLHCPALLAEAEREHPLEVMRIRVGLCLQGPHAAPCRSVYPALDAACAGGSSLGCFGVGATLHANAQSECAARFLRFACRIEDRADPCHEWDEPVPLPLISGEHPNPDVCRAPTPPQVLFESARTVDEAIDATTHVASRTDLLLLFYAEFLPRGDLLAVDGDHAVAQFFGFEFRSRGVQIVHEAESVELTIFTGQELQLLTSIDDAGARRFAVTVLKPRLIALRDRLAHRYRRLQPVDHDEDAALPLTTAEDTETSTTVTLRHPTTRRRLWQRTFPFRDCFAQSNSSASWDPATQRFLVRVARDQADCGQRHAVLGYLPR